MDDSSEDLNQEFHDSFVVTHYRRFASRIMNFKLKGSFDHFVFNALSPSADIIPTNTKDALFPDELEVILSDFL